MKINENGIIREMTPEEEIEFGRITDVEMIEIPGEVDQLRADVDYILMMLEEE